jgi:hypothetical protein
VTFCRGVINAVLYKEYRWTGIPILDDSCRITSSFRADLARRHTQRADGENSMAKSKTSLATNMGELADFKFDTSSYISLRPLSGLVVKESPKLTRDAKSGQYKIKEKAKK